MTTTDIGAPVLAAIDVGTNAARLIVARVRPEGGFEVLHKERSGIRPGEGVFATGSIPPATAARLERTMREYASIIRKTGATVRAVATAALREARNREAIVSQIRDASGIDLEVISGQEEARLLCVGVFDGAAPHTPGLLIDIGGGSTEIVVASGDGPVHLWSVGVGAVRLTELFQLSDVVSPDTLSLVRTYVRGSLREAIGPPPEGLADVALGSSGSIQALVDFATGGTSSVASASQLTDAVERLAHLSGDKRRQLFDARRADVITAGAIVLESVLLHLCRTQVRAVDRGLRDGVLVDLRRRLECVSDSSAFDALRGLGRRFGFDEAHATQVMHLAEQLFDALRPLHGLSAEARRLLSLAALIHDVGHGISAHKHHKHTAYIVQNADVAGLSPRERRLVALTARFHRRTLPERDHAELAGVDATDVRMLRKIVPILRLADAFDRGRRRRVSQLEVHSDGRTVRLDVHVRGSAELELWDARREAAAFERIYDRTLDIRAIEGDEST